YSLTGSVPGFGAGADLWAWATGCFWTGDDGGAEDVGDGAGAAGGTGAAWPRLTDRPNSRHCPFTAANSNSKLTCVGTEVKKPAMCSMPLPSICGSTVNCGSSAATPERSILSLRCLAKISASFAAVLT